MFREVPIGPQPSHRLPSSRVCVRRRGTQALPGATTGHYKTLLENADAIGFFSHATSLRDLALLPSLLLSRPFANPRASRQGTPAAWWHLALLGLQAGVSAHDLLQNSARTAPPPWPRTRKNTVECSRAGSNNSHFLKFDSLVALWVGLACKRRNAPVGKPRYLQPLLGPTWNGLARGWQRVTVQRRRNAKLTTAARRPRSTGHQARSRATVAAGFASTRGRAPFFLKRGPMAITSTRLSSERDGTTGRFH